MIIKILKVEELAHAPLYPAPGDYFTTACRVTNLDPQPQTVKVSILYGQVTAYSTDLWMEGNQTSTLLASGESAIFGGYIIIPQEAVPGTQYIMAVESFWLDNTTGQWRLDDGYGIFDVTVGGLTEDINFYNLQYTYNKKILEPGGVETFTISFWHQGGAYSGAQLDAAIGNRNSPPSLVPFSVKAEETLYLHPFPVDAVEKRYTFQIDVVASNLKPMLYDSRVRLYNIPGDKLLEYGPLDDITVLAPQDIFSNLTVSYSKG